MKRRILRWILLPVAILLGLWGVSAALDARPNPILVTVGPRGSTGGAFVEVEVARARPVPMKVGDMPMVSRGRTVGTLPDADPEAVAAEEQELRAALDAWLAEPGRGLRIEQSWTSGEMSTWFFRTSQRYRAVLHARLVPVGPK